ncbi:MAG: ABC transporter substrate-binding protein, partial [Hyphomicrobiales bacterium]
MPLDETYIAHPPTAGTRRRTVLTAGLGAAAAIAGPLAAPARAEGAPELRWRLSSAYAKSLD